MRCYLFFLMFLSAHGLYKTKATHRFVGGKSQLISAKFSSFGIRCVRFSYRTRGPGKKTLIVRLLRDHRLSPVLWSTTTHVQGKWKLGYVQINLIGRFQVCRHKLNYSNSAQPRPAKTCNTCGIRAHLRQSALKV